MAFNRKHTVLLVGQGALVFLGAVFMAGGCRAKVDLDSVWREKSVFVDGVNTEWDGATTYFEDKKLSVGIQNDDEYLYVALFVADPQTQAQIIMRGCTVWFDPSGKGEKQFGVHYPLGMRLGARGGEGRQRPSGAGGGDEEASGRREGRGAWGSAPDIDALRERLAGEPKTVELLGPEPGELHTQLLTENGIEVIALLHETSLIYEMKIPLARDGDRPYGIGARPGMKIAVGLETPEIKRPERPSGMDGRFGGGRGGGGMGGMPGGMGGMGGGRGGMGGGRGGDRPEPPAPLEVWASVKLAEPPPAG